MQTVQDFLTRYPDACSEAQDWLKILGVRTMQEAWRQCNRVGWMLWALHRIKHKSYPGLRHFAVDCAVAALDRERAAGREPDPRSWAAVEAARAYLEGRGTLEQMLKARDAAWDARGAGNAAGVAWVAAWTAADEFAWVVHGAVESADRLRFYVAEWPM